MSPPEPILILHNTFGKSGEPLYESRSGVMDQVRAVEAACLELGYVAHITAIEDLRHLSHVLEYSDRRLIFNLMEEFLGDVRQASLAPSVCRAFGKSCTGNDTDTLLLAQNKIQAKAVLAGSGLPTPPGTVVPVGEKPDTTALTQGMYILKPAFCDASEGIDSDSVVQLPEDAGRLEALAATLHRRFAQPVIIERYIPARELNVSVIECDGRPRVMPLAEIDFSAFDDSRPKIVDYSAKWDTASFAYHHTPRKIPADLPSETAEQVRRLAAAAWEVLGCRDYIRVDFRLDERLCPYIIEVNPNPDISPEAGFAAALTAGGVSYEHFVDRMLGNARERL